MPTYVIQVTSSVVCATCWAANPIRGLLSSLPCYHCDTVLVLPDWNQALVSEKLTDIFLPSEALTSMTPGETIEKHVPDTYTLRCREVPSAAVQGPSRVANGIEQHWVRGLTHIVGEQPEGRLRATVEGITTSCHSCGHTLDLTPEKRTVTCPYCQAENLIPAEIWRRLRPIPADEPFWLVGELTDEARFQYAVEMTDLSGSAHEYVTKATQIPEKAWEPLTHYANPTIRRALASRPDAPASILEAMARDNDLGVVLAISENTDTSAALQETLAKHGDVVIRSFISSLRKDEKGNPTGFSAQWTEKQLRENHALKTFLLRMLQDKDLKPALYRDFYSALFMQFHNLWTPDKSPLLDKDELYDKYYVKDRAENKDTILMHLFRRWRAHRLFYTTPFWGFHFRNFIWIEMMAVFTPLVIGEGLVLHYNKITFLQEAKLIPKPKRPKLAGRIPHYSLYQLRSMSPEKRLRVQKSMSDAKDSERVYYEAQKAYTVQVYAQNGLSKINSENNTTLTYVFVFFLNTLLFGFLLIRPRVQKALKKGDKIRKVISRYLTQTFPV